MRRGGGQEEKGMGREIEENRKRKGREKGREKGRKKEKFTDRYSE